MCGIIAIVRGPGARRLLPASEVLDRLDVLQRAVTAGDDLVATARRTADGLRELDAVLRSGDGIALLVRDRDTAIRTGAVCAAVGDWVAARRPGSTRTAAPPATRWRRPTPRSST